MSFRKKLSDRLVAGEEVELRIPPIDPASDVYAQAGKFASQMKELIDERNAYKERAEALLCQLDSVHHQLHHTAHEREQYRRTAFRMINANGKLLQALDTIENLFRSIRGISNEVNSLSSQVPKEPPKGTQEEEVVNLDQGPTLEEIDQLKTTLARLPTTA